MSYTLKFSYTACFSLFSTVLSHIQRSLYAQTATQLCKTKHTKPPASDKQQLIRATEHDKKCNCRKVVHNMNALKNDENLEKERGFSKYSILQFILTIDSFVQEVNEPFNSSQHLFPGEIQQ